MLRNTHDPSQAEPEIDAIVLIKAARFGALLAVVFMAFNFFLVGTVLAGLVIALIGGFFVGMARYPQIKENYQKLENNPPVFPGEIIIMEGYATHYRSFEGECHGYLCLTNQKLHFSYYPFKDGMEDVIMLGDIDRIETYSKYFMPSGIRLRMKNGKTQKFTVQKWRGGWIEEIFRYWMKSRREACEVVAKESSNDDSQKAEV